MQRKLAAILAADVVGYSRLMGADEEGTRATLTAHQNELINPCIAEHNGRVVKTTGDGLLAEFASVVNAVRCAIAFQDGMRTRNAGVPEDQSIQFRVGINLGDVIIEGDDIHGDGVNVAARLESIAEPGAIYLSGDVQRQIEGKVSVAVEDLGERTLKNIARPVRVYRVADATDGGGRVEHARIASPPPEEEIPSIAVLPFDNLSNDPDQEYFADGMVEEIITALARFSWLRVMARNSSFQYKGRSVDVRQVADELKVRYVLEGSVRRAGQRIRITGQLIDAATGAHIWADRFDGELADIFDLQDNITASVVGAIEPSLRKAEIERSRRKRPESLAAYDLYLRALVPLHKLRPEANAGALELLERAIALDPGYAPALANAAWAYEQRLLHGWPTSRDGDAETATGLARRALATNSGDAATIAMASFVLTIVGHDYEAGRAAARRALALNPNSATVSWMAGWVILFAGEPEAAIEVFEHALRISPTDPYANYLLNGLGMSQLILGRAAKAFDCASQSVAFDDEVDVAYYVLVSACGHLGRAEDAKKAIAKLQTLAPGITVSGFEIRMPFRSPDHLAILLDGLRKAGLPE